MLCRLCVLRCSKESLSKEYRLGGFIVTNARAAPCGGECVIDKVLCDV